MKSRLGSPSPLTSTRTGNLSSGRAWSGACRSVISMRILGRSSPTPTTKIGILALRARSANSV